MLSASRLDLFLTPTGKTFLTQADLKELITAYKELKQLKEQVPVAEFVTLFNTPKGTIEFLGRVPDRKLCDLKEGDLLYKQEKPINNFPWLQVIDEALVVHHVGVADLSDTYDQAKQKLNLLLCAAESIGKLQSPAVTVPDNVGG